VVNEFVLGTLIGENITLGKYQQYNERFYENISQMFSLLAVQAFRVQPKENRESLWRVFDQHPFRYDPAFFFKIDIDFKGEIVRDYRLATLNDFQLEGYSFTREIQFESMIFTGCK